MPKKLSSKSSGEQAELYFAAECCRQGITVCFPHSDDVAYDFVLDTGRKLLKIQVKSSRFKYGKGYKFSTNYKTSNHGFDFYVFFVHKTRDFYIVPLSKFKKENFYTNNNDVYKNNWQLFK